MQLDIDYELLDSGSEGKLERFGSVVLSRPSSLAIWKRRLPDEIWQASDAHFDPESGWKLQRKLPKEWLIKTATGLQMALRLQTNGQIGVFPEHSLYLNLLRNHLASANAEGARVRVLNLFAYSGLASLICLQAGAEVTHVDLSKSALKWATNNLTLNKLQSAAIRMIAEDAIVFCQKELKRNQSYDLIIADPPGFSRQSKNKSWNIEEILPDFMENLIQLLSDKGGCLFITSHQLAAGCITCANLASDCSAAGSLSIRPETLVLQEAGSDRRLPSGFLSIIQKNRASRRK